LISIEVAGRTWDDAAAIAGAVRSMGRPWPAR